MDKEFEYGPVSKGVYIALLSIIPLVPIYFPHYSLHYFCLMIFLGFGLRRFLLVTGLYSVWNTVRLKLLAKWDKKFLEERAAKIDREIALKKYKMSRVRDPRLPKNW